MIVLFLPNLILHVLDHHCGSTTVMFSRAWSLLFTFRSSIAGRESGYSTIMVNNSLILYIDEGKTNYVLTECIFYFKIKINNYYLKLLWQNLIFRTCYMWSGRTLTLVMANEFWLDMLLLLLLGNFDNIIWENTHKAVNTLGQQKTCT